MRDQKGLKKHMQISLSQILNEIVEEVVEENRTLTEGITPEAEEALAGEVSPQTGVPAEALGDDGADDEVLLAKLASAFTPEEAAELSQRLEAGEISEEDIINHLASLESQVNESVTMSPSVISALSSGAGALGLRKQIRSANR